ncbi:MAG: hypothetical protein IJY40_00660 [Oscillospiraceae bacterium]|nr:hypothetical protein [Oscillospiraceae bacterium]
MAKDLDVSATYYGSRENLLDLVTQRLMFYRPILGIYTFLNLDELQTGSTARFIRETAEHCLSTYDPQEPLVYALERCIVDKLHQYSYP